MVKIRSAITLFFPGTNVICWPDLQKSLIWWLVCLTQLVQFVLCHFLKIVSRPLKVSLEGSADCTTLIFIFHFFVFNDSPSQTKSSFTVLADRQRRTCDTSQWSYAGVMMSSVVITVVREFIGRRAGGSRSVMATAAEALRVMPGDKKTVDLLWCVTTTETWSSCPSHRTVRGEKIGLNLCRPSLWVSYYQKCIDVTQTAHNPTTTLYGHFHAWIPDNTRKIGAG